MSDTSLVFNAVGRDRGVSSMLARTSAQVNASNARSVAGTMALRGAWIAAGAAAVALAGSALRAAGAAAAIPAAIASGLAIIGAGRAITMGLGDAWQKTGQAAVGGGGKAGGAATKMAAKTHEVKQATLALRDAQREAQQAQEDLNRARQEESERLSDLSRNLQGAKLDEKDAIAAVAKAEMDLALARRTGQGDKIDEASRNYEQSKQTLLDVKDRVSDLSREQTDGAKKGVEGSDSVQAALQAQQTAQERVTEAAYQLAEAQKGVETASAGAAGGGINPAAEALAKLSPNGRAVVLMLRQLAPSWRAAANAGQQAAFAGVAGDLKRLSDLYLPSVTRWLTRMGGAFNFAMRDMAKWLGSAQGMETVNAIMEASVSVAWSLARAVKPIVNGIAQWVSVGSSFLPGFASNAEGLAKTFEAWSTRMKDSGKAAEWIKNGVTVLTQFWHIARDVAKSILAIVHAGGDGGATVSALERGAAAMRKFLESSKGQEQIKAVFTAIQNAVAALGPLFGAVAKNGNDLAVSTEGMVSGFSWVLKTIQPILPVLAALGTAYFLLKQTGVTAVAGMGLKVAQIASHIAMSRALRAHTRALGENTAASGVNAGAQAREAAAANGGILARGKAILSLIAQKVALAASAVASGVAAAAGWVMAAAEWAMASPIALIVLGIALVAAGIFLLWKYCPGFRKAVVGAWNAIKDAAVAVWNWIKTNAPKIFGILTLPYRLAWTGIKAVYGWIKDGAATAFIWVRDKFNSLKDWFSKLPGRIGTALRGISRFISAPFRAAFNAVARLWNRTVGGMQFSVPSWVPGIGGNAFALPRVPELAKGGRVTSAGSVLVGEKGPELLTLDAGAQVTPLDHPAAGRGGGGSCHHTFDVTGLDRHLKALIREMMRTGGLQMEG